MTTGELLAQLQAMLADLNGYVERRADEIAAPLIESGADRARELVSVAEGEAQAQLQRHQDLMTEMRRRISAADRNLENVKRYRSRLAAAVGRHPSEPWPTLVAEIEARLKRGSEPR